MGDSARAKLRRLKYAPASTQGAIRQLWKDDREKRLRA
jgi:hypothetical protein